MIHSSTFSNPHFQTLTFQDKDEPDLEQKHPEYEKAEIGNSSFEKKLFRKLQEKPNNELHQWVSSFADKLSFCHHVGIKEAGIGLVHYLLDFPEKSLLASAIRDYLQELVQSDLFLNKCINLDDLALNQAENQLVRIRKAIKSLVKPSKLIDVINVPENLEVNPFFVSDPRVMLYNMFAKSGNSVLSIVNDTMEMELALILAGLREHFFQKIIPQDEKQRTEVELYVKNKLKDRLTLVQIGEEKREVDEKIIHLVYKRMSPLTYMDSILKGGRDNKFDYINIQNKKSRYSLPIEKHHGYANPEVMIHHVHQALNSNDNSVFKLSLLKERLQSQYGANAESMIKAYFDEKGEKISSQGVRAMLFSTGYLQIASLKNYF